MSNQKAMACQRINNNGRKLWLVYDGYGHVVNILDDYYNKPEECTDLVTLPDLRVTPAEFREWMNMRKAREEKRKGV